MAATRIRTDRPRNTARRASGFSLIELLLVVSIILIIAAIAIPNLLKARIAANQADAASDVRTMSSAAVLYFSTYGVGYPATFASMGGIVGPPPSCTAAGLLDNVIATPPNVKTGYHFTYAPQGTPFTGPIPPACVAGANDYLATAAPVSVGVTGNSSYCSDQPGVIHYDPTGLPPATSAQCEALTLLQ